MGETEYKTSIEKILRVVLSKLWLMFIISVAVAVVMAVVTVYLISPVYSSTAKFYVQNDSTGINESLTSQDLSAAKSLVDTYIVMIKTDTVLKEVAEKADVDYSPEKLSKMMAAGSINNTEVFYITISSTDKQEALDVTEAIVDIVPGKISDFIKGSSVAIVQEPELANEPDSPSVVLNTILGFLAGFVISFAVIVIREITDTRVVTEEDIKILFDKYTVIGQIPTIAAATATAQSSTAKKSKGTETGKKG